jgi:hypothetical protein
MLIDDDSDQGAARLIGQRVSISGHHKRSDRRPASDLVQTICSFLNLRAADPSIGEETFGPENIAIFFAIPARRTWKHFVVRHGCDRIHAELIGFHEGR